MKTSSIASMIGMAGVALSLPATRSPQYQLETVHQFGNFTWIENMAVRSNGQILSNNVNGSEIYLVDPQNPSMPPPIIAILPNNTCITGITEVQPDIFYTQSVIGDVYEFAFAPNSSAVWEVDMRTYNGSVDSATVRKVTNIPSAGVLNGMTRLSNDTILMADSTLGQIWRLNINTGAYDVLLRDSTLAPIPGAFPSFGVNGVHVVNDSTLYFSNTNQSLLGRFQIMTDGTPTGSVVNISTAVPAADDFAVDACGNIWLTENVQNTLVRVSPEGDVQTIAGGKNSSDLIGPVAAVFGRGSERERDTLYISTNGLTLDPVTHASLTTNGKLAALHPGQGGCGCS